MRRRRGARRARHQPPLHTRDCSRPPRRCGAAWPALQPGAGRRRAPPACTRLKRWPCGSASARWPATITSMEWGLMACSPSASTPAHTPLTASPWSRWWVTLRAGCTARSDGSLLPLLRRQQSARHGRRRPSRPWLDRGEALLALYRIAVERFVVQRPDLETATFLLQEDAVHRQADDDPLDLPYDFRGRHPLIGSRVGVAALQFRCHGELERGW